MLCLKCTYGAMQCAAVNTCVEDIKLAPQYWPELVLEGLNKAANQGHSFLSAGLPLTILVRILQPKNVYVGDFYCNLHYIKLKWIEFSVDGTQGAQGHN